MSFQSIGPGSFGQIQHGNQGPSKQRSNGRGRVYTNKKQQKVEGVELEDYFWLVCLGIKLMMLLLFSEVISSKRVVVAQCLVRAVLCVSIGCCGPDGLLLAVGIAWDNMRF